MSGEERKTSTLKDAQRTKIELVRRAEGGVDLSISDASRALNIPAADLLDLFMQDKGLCVEGGSEEGWVLLSIKDVTISPRRNLWNEVLATLERGRSELGRQVDLYKGLFIASKIIGEANGLGLGDISLSSDAPEALVNLIEFAKTGGEVIGPDVDQTSLQVMATVVYLGLPKGTRDELVGLSQSPEFLLARNT